LNISRPDRYAIDKYYSDTGNYLDALDDLVAKSIYGPCRKTRSLVAIRHGSLPSWSVWRSAAQCITLICGFPAMAAVINMAVINIWFLKEKRLYKEPLIQVSLD